MQAQELLNVLKTRRSVRKFLKDPVPEKDIESIITAASWAPSGTNHQNWHFIVVRSGELKDKMVQAVTDKVCNYANSMTMEKAQKGFLNYTNYFTFFKQAPVIINVVKTPYDSITQKLMKRYGLPIDFLSSTDVQGPAAAIQNLLLMAHGLGYGTCWMTGPLIAKDNIEEILGITAPDELMAVIPIGRPEFVPPPPHRKEVKGIVTYK